MSSQSVPSHKRAMRLLFLGAPGAGKGTYASRLSKKWFIPHISTGDIIRNEIKSDSELGKQFKAFSNSGKLVPDDLVVEIAKKRLSMSDVANGYILDGFPRTTFQASKLAEFAAPSLCVNIYLPDHLLIKKLCGRRVCSDCGANYNVANICEGEYDMPPLLPQPSDCQQCKGAPNLTQREDDTESVVEKRLNVYKQETAPLIDFYTQKGLLMNFKIRKGVKDLAEIEKQIIEILDK